MFEECESNKSNLYEDLNLNDVLDLSYQNLQEMPHIQNEHICVSNKFPNIYIYCVICSAYRFYSRQCLNDESIVIFYYIGI